MKNDLHLVCPHCQSINRVPTAKLSEHPNCGRCQQPLFTGEPIELTRRLLELRGHHLARPAPRCPEIYQQWQVAALHVARERRRGQLDGFAREQGLLAAAAVGMFR